MLQVLLGTLRTSSRRYVATTLAIVMGVAFATVTLDLAPVGQVASTYRVRIYTYCPSTTVSMDYDDITVTGTYTP